VGFIVVVVDDVLAETIFCPVAPVAPLSPAEPVDPTVIIMMMMMIIIIIMSIHVVVEKPHGLHGYMYTIK